MRRVFTSLLLLGSLVACSGGSDLPAGGDLVGSDQAPADSEQPPYSGERPVSDSQEPEVASEAAVSACEGSTSALESILLLGQVACAKAAACGLAVPTQAELENLEGDPFETLGFWPLLCAAGQACEQQPEQCATSFEDIELTDSQVCPEQVLECWNAVADLLGCEPTEQQTEQIDENLPAACEGVFPEAEQYEEREQRPEEMPQPGGDGMGGAASA
jgi:hypothetical protein